MRSRCTGTLSSSPSCTIEEQHGSRFETASPCEVREVSWWVLADLHAGRETKPSSALRSSSRSWNMQHAVLKDDGPPGYQGGGDQAGRPSAWKSKETKAAHKPSTSTSSRRGEERATGRVLASRTRRVASGVRASQPSPLRYPLHSLHSLHSLPLLPPCPLLSLSSSLPSLPCMRVIKLQPVSTSSHLHPLHRSRRQRQACRSNDEAAPPQTPHDRQREVRSSIAPSAPVSAGASSP